ncbi:MAG: VWA domain-containing protein, partial [Deltaproteobacteria bacterium]
MRGVVRRLAERLKARLSRRRKARRKGALSVRRTLRKNLSTGGFPAKLVFRSRRAERPEVLVLCDVSDSVRNVSRLMLQFVYTLQELYARVRSFVFVSDVGEVTHLFKKMDVSSAVDLATAGKVINTSANSNYGHALK